jgi:hypothetical protein
MVIHVGNTFSGGDRDLYMSSGGTDIFVEVMMLAVSALASREWDLRFAALIALQDQNVMGRGVVGFRLEGLDWGDKAAEQVVNKSFVLDAVDLALGHHRWDDLGYDPPFAQDHLRRFRQMVEMFDPSTAVADPRESPSLDGLVADCCVRHRVLSPLPWYGTGVRRGKTIRACSGVRVTVDHFARKEAA